MQEFSADADLLSSWQKYGARMNRCRQAGQGFKGSFLSIVYITVLPVSQFRPAGRAGADDPDLRAVGAKRSLIRLSDSICEIAKKPTKDTVVQLLVLLTFSVGILVQVYVSFME